MNISGELLCLYSARVERRGDSFVVDVPEAELADGPLVEGGVYRVGLFSTEKSESSSSVHDAPPVEVGDVRRVLISDLGDQGDGIGRIERGYVVIVPESSPGEEVTVEIITVQENYALGEIIQN